MPTPAPSPAGADSGITTDAASARDANATTDASTTAKKTTGTGTYQSNLSDYSIQVVDVLATYEKAQPKTSGGFESEVKIRFVDFAGACEDYRAGIRRAGTKDVEIELEKTGATATAAEITPGTYAFDPAEGAIYYGRATLGATCSSTYAPLPFSPDASGAINQLVITSLTDTHVTGTYEIKAPDGRFVKGSFDADVCNKTTTTTTTSCQ